MIGRIGRVGGMRNSRLAGGGEIGVVVGIGGHGSLFESSSIDQINNIAIDKVDHILSDLPLLPPPPPHPQTHCEDCNDAKRDGDGNADLGARAQAGWIRRWAVSGRRAGCRGRRCGKGGAAPGGLLS